MQRAAVRFSGFGRRLNQPVITHLMATALAAPDLLSLAAGFTDTATLPADPIREVVDKILRRPGPPESLQYGTNAGRPLLRELLARRISQQDRNLSEVCATDNLFITNGSQQALALATQVLCDPGDIVLVEKPTYFVYLDGLRGLGVHVQNLPLNGDRRLDAEGLNAWLDELDRQGELGRLKAVYIQGYYANPSSRTLSEAEKECLAEALRARGIFPPVIEDAAYRELYYEAPPAERSILALDAFAEFPRLYLGTLTKSFATGLKVGFGYCTDSEWLNRILFLKGQQDFGTGNFSQAILEEVMGGGHFDRYLPTLRRHYGQKMQALNETLETEGLRAKEWQWEVPSGGLYLWLTGPKGIDTTIESPFGQRCLANGVLYVPGDLCCGAEVETHFVRLSFGVLSLSDLREAGRRFAKAAVNRGH
jgi:2-aminoadipate transaminase